MSYSKNTEAYMREYKLLNEDEVIRENAGFFERFANFAYDQLHGSAVLEERTLYLSRLAVLTAAGEEEEFALLIPAALHAGLTPEEIREIVYQGQAYLGIGRVRPVLKRISEVFRELDISGLENTPAEKTEEERRADGTDAQIELFGEPVREFYKRSRINYYVVTHCFGDHFSRKVLTVRERALITFCFLYTLGGVDHELSGYIKGNLLIGNTAEMLADVIYQNIPFIGFPRSLNAMNVLNKTVNESQ